mgnify:FL=1
MIFLNFWLSFLAGLFAPLGAVCVLPLYPGFLSYLANQSESNNKNSILKLGITVALGVISSMALFGLIFTKILEQSLTKVIGIISPIAFEILGIISIFMILGIDLSKYFGKFNAPESKNPVFSSFLFGAFFGLIVLPCNPSSLIILFALSSSTTSFLINFIGFILFGLGMAFPLLLFAIISNKKSLFISN